LGKGLKPGVAGVTGVQELQNGDGWNLAIDGLNVTGYLIGMRIFVGLEDVNESMKLRNGG
jgi:hypothetical protein